MSNHQLRHIARSHIGLVRGNNEDAFACAPEHGLFVIADGMGGLARGEVASRLAADKLLAGAIARLDPTFGPATVSHQEILNQAITSAQEEIHAENTDAPEKVPMGTTATAVTIAGGAVHYAHAGDSRLLVISQTGAIEQVTTDQTVAQRMIERGEDPVRAARSHGHILTNYIGINGIFTPQTGSRELAPGDVLLMCTDGLSDLVAEDEIAAIVSDAAPDLERAADALIDRANAHGGRDNITVILIQPAG